jgi:hypothetical protein
MDVYDGAAWTEMGIDTEADHFEKCQFVRSGSICAISPREVEVLKDRTAAARMARH